MSRTRGVNLLIYESENGRDGWRPASRDSLPTWVLDPEVMYRLANGEECMKCDDGDAGSMWYRAVHVCEVADLAQ